MSHRHEGISCDVCHRSGFTLRRYKCLLCYDYDLCGNCYDAKRESNNHKIGHPMQCLITKSDYGLFYAGEVCTDLAFSYTCPICGKLGHNINTLVKHINDVHPDSNLEVICPVCASLSDGNANFQTRNILIHITTKHAAYLDQDGSGSSSKRSSKTGSKNLIEYPGQASKTSSKNITNTINQLKTMSTSSNEVCNSQNPISSNANVISGTDMSEEPLLHSLLNQLYTWRTRREQMANLSRNYSIPDARTNQDNGLDAGAMLNDDNAISQPCSLSRSALKQTLQDRTRNLRKKLGSKNIIDLTEHWKFGDPDSELFNFEDDLENITFSLNQASLNVNDMDDSEYFDEDEEMVPWPQELSSESIYNQLKSLTLEPSRLGPYAPASANTTNPKSNSNSFFDSSKPNTETSINYQHLPYFLTSDNHNLEFTLPSFATHSRSPQMTRRPIEKALEFTSTVDNKKISVNLTEVMGSQGFLVRDVTSNISSKPKKCKTKNSKPEATTSRTTRVDAPSSSLPASHQREERRDTTNTETDNPNLVPELEERSQLTRDLLFSSLFAPQNSSPTDKKDSTNNSDIISKSKNLTDFTSETQ